MFILWAALALAGPVDEVRAIAWARGPAAELVRFAESGDPQVRLAAARALGRLRDPAALSPLVALCGDPEEAVRVEAASALGLTPGAEEAVLSLLAAAPPVEEPQLRTHLLDALGYVGTERSLPVLREALRGPWPMMGGAARALGRLGRSDVPGVSEAVGDLIACTGRNAPYEVEACGWALRRIGIDAERGDPWRPLVGRVRTAGSAAAKAELLSAVWPAADARSRDKLLTLVLLEPSPALRARQLSLVQAGQTSSSALIPLLADPHPWVSAEAVAALGRLGDEAALRALQGGLDGADPWRAAERVEALSAAGALVPWAPGDPAPVRAASVGSLDAEARVGVALHDPSQRVRSAAAYALLEGTPDPDLIAKLSVAEDRSVREAALDAAGTPIPPEPQRELTVDLSLREAVLQTSKGELHLRFLTEVAPLAVSAFAGLAEADFYDGLIFHRVIPGFVAQGGCPRGDGTGGPGWVIPDEVSALDFAPGAVGMARGARDTGGSQFFLTTGHHPHLTGEYTQFAVITEGLEVAERLQVGDRILDVTLVREAP
ncbi:MAG: peptidylprolyl isomerase [Deltaproteobacteria bacterium]|nr:peptidylprolyl isomerase [Deltaproteobacteria bacterium]